MPANTNILALLRQNTFVRTAKDQGARYLVLSTTTSAAAIHFL